MKLVRSISIIATITAGFVFIVLGLIYSGVYYVGVDQPHWPVTGWLLDQARIRSIRAHGSAIAVPAGLDNEGTILAGVPHFAEHCVVCHGAPGVPQGDLAEGLYPRPPNLATSA